MPESTRHLIECYLSRLACLTRKEAATEQLLLVDDAASDGGLVASCNGSFQRSQLLQQKRAQVLFAI